MARQPRGGGSMEDNVRVNDVSFKRKALSKRLEKLKSRIESPNLTEEEIKAIRSEVEECQKQFVLLKN